jgi:hypothetical protein
MKYFAWRTFATAITASLVLAGPAAGHTLQHRDRHRYESLDAYSLEHRPIVRFVVLATRAPARAPLDPIYIVAKRHGWDEMQVQYWLDILKKESGSTLGHYDLTVWNPNRTYFGCGQLQGPAAYTYYGGNPYTPLGQLTGDANYIVQHGYGTPEAAWESELERNFY